MASVSVRSGRVGGDAAQRGVHGQAADPVLTGRAAQYGAGGEPQMGQALAVGGGHGLGDLAHELVGVVGFAAGRAASRAVSSVASGSHSWTT